MCVIGYVKGLYRFFSCLISAAAACVQTTKDGFNVKMNRVHTVIKAKNSCKTIKHSTLLTVLPIT